MTERQKECIREIQELMLSINSVVKKYELENEFVACLTAGFIDLDSSYIDEDGDERANMNLLSTFSVTDEEELDDLLSYCVEAYRIQVEEDSEPDTSSIDYWLNFGLRDGDIN
jgi:hypothetical protein